MLCVHSLSALFLPIAYNPAAMDSPNFLIVGAEKCGTTWLADMLRQHPRAFIPAEKELHYFNRQFSDFPEIKNFNFDKPLAWYLKFFAAAKESQVIGEACPAYFWDDSAAARIHAFNPALKILILLRNPAERTFSAYRFWMQRGIYLRIPFRAAVTQHRELLLKRSLYFAQVKRYFDLFPRDQIKVWITDSADSTMTDILTQAEDFLALTSLVPASASQRANVTADARNLTLNWLTARVRRFVRRQRLFVPLLDLLREINFAQQVEGWRVQNKVKSAAPTTVAMMTDDERDWIQNLLKDDIAQLEKLLGINLEHWQ